MKLRLSRVVRDFGKEFAASGHQCYLVGGAVRELIRNTEPADFDIATDATPDQVKSLFRRVIPTGIKHGTVTVIFQDIHFEVTTFRSESDYTDSRRPDTVQYLPSLDGDLKRRDFTINAIAADAVTGQVTDPHGGRGDLKKGVIRAIGNPRERFEEDGLRLLRACRFASQLHFTIDPPTLTGMRDNCENIRAVSPERIREEIDKILKSLRPSVGFLIMEKTGLLQEVLPELASCRGIEQKGDHEFDVLDHSLFSCDGAPADRLEVRLSALFHDIGKPAAKAAQPDGTVAFHKHEHISAELTETIMRRLKYPKAVERKVVHLIAMHMFAYDDSWSDAAVRRFLRKAGPENISDLFALRIADGYGVRREKPSGIGVRRLSKRIDDVMKAEEALDIKDLEVNGNDLYDEVGIPKGIEMGQVLKFLLEAVLDDPSQNDRRTLLELARNFYKSRMSTET